MLYPTRVLEVFPRDNDHCKRLKDPQKEGTLFHLEAWLPFSEAVKLERGNANVRPPSETKKPFRDMMITVEKDPGSFHLKNRGIIYILSCDSNIHIVSIISKGVLSDNLNIGIANFCALWNGNISET